HEAAQAPDDKRAPMDDWSQSDNNVVQFNGSYINVYLSITPPRASEHFPRISQENSKRRERVRQRRLAAVLHLPGRRGAAHQSVTSRGLSSRWRSLRRGPRFNEVAITGWKPLEEGPTRI